MKLLELAKGKKMMVKTNVKVDVELTIESITPRTHTRDLEPATPANDWWPAQESWTTYDVKFTNGHVENFSSLDSIKFID